MGIIEMCLCPWKVFPFRFRGFETQPRDTRISLRRAVDTPLTPIFCQESDRALRHFQGWQELNGSLRIEVVRSSSFLERETVETVDLENTISGVRSLNRVAEHHRNKLEKHRWISSMTDWISLVDNKILVVEAIETIWSSMERLFYCSAIRTEVLSVDICSNLFSNNLRIKRDNSDSLLLH